MPIRYMQHVRLGTAQQALGSFRPILITQSENGVSPNSKLRLMYQDLYNALCRPTLFNEDGKPEHDEAILTALVHSILVLVLRWKCGIRARVGSLVEQALAILMTTPEGQV